MATVSSKTFFGGQAPQEVPPVVAQQEPNYLQRVAGDFKTAGQNIVDTTTKLGSELAQQQNVPFAQQDFSFGTLAKRTGSALSTGIQTAGEFAGAMFSPVTEAVKPALEATGLAEPVGQAVKSITDTAPVQAAIEYYKTLDPETQKNLEALYNIGTAVAGTKALNFGSTVAPAALEVAGKAGSEAIGAFGSGAGKVAGKVLPTSEGIMQRVARIPKARQQAFEKTAGESVGKYLEKRGLFDAPDELVPKLYERFTQSRAAADEGLAKLPGTYKDATIGNALSQLLAREKAVSLPGVASKDSVRVQQLVSKYRRGGLTMSEVNEVKRLFERNVKLGYQKSLSTQPEKIAQATNLDSKLREWQFNKAKELGFKELPDINKETQLARQLADDLGKEIAGTAGNNALGLTDAILVSGGDPAAIAMLITKKTAGSKAVQAKIAEWLSKNKVGEVKSSTPSTPPTAQVSQLPSPKRNPDQIFPQVDEAIKRGITNYARNPKLGLATKDITKDYDTVAKALSGYDTSSPTLNLGKGNKMSTPLSEDAATLADLKAKLETGVLTKEEIATAGRLLQKEGAFGNPLIQEAKKYKTAEEFVKAQGTPMFHGTAKEFDKFDMSKSGSVQYSDWGKGLYLTPSKSMAKSYGNQAVRHFDSKVNRLYTAMEDKAKSYGTTGMMKSIDKGSGKITQAQYDELQQMEDAWRARLYELDKENGGKVMEFYLSPDAKVMEYTYEGITDPYLSREALAKGYDAVLIDKGRATEELLVMNTDKLMTRSQLTDIWKQAHPESNFSPEVQRIINMTK